MNLKLFPMHSSGGPIGRCVVVVEGVVISGPGSVVVVLDEIY